MKIMKARSRPTKLASSNWFTSTVWQDPIVEAPEPARVWALKVVFETGARIAWHTHSLGQALHVVSGVGLVGLRNEQPQVIKAGDTAWERTLAWSDSWQQHGPYSYSRGIGRTCSRVVGEGV